MGKAVNSTAGGHISSGKKVARHANPKAPLRKSGSSVHSAGTDYEKSGKPHSRLKNTIGS